MAQVRINKNQIPAILTLMFSVVLFCLPTAVYSSPSETVLRTAVPGKHNMNPYFVRQHVNHVIIIDNRQTFKKFCNERICSRDPSKNILLTFKKSAEVTIVHEISTIALLRRICILRI
jgi:hypothetical protein